MQMMVAFEWLLVQAVTVLRYAKFLNRAAPHVQRARITHSLGPYHPNPAYHVPVAATRRNPVQHSVCRVPSGTYRLHRAPLTALCVRQRKVILADLANALPCPARLKPYSEM
jgi:hypothetical protein